MNQEQLRKKAAENRYPISVTSFEHEKQTRHVQRSAFIAGAEWEAENDKWIPFNRTDKEILKYKQVLVYEDLSSFDRESRVIQAYVHFSEKGQVFGGPNSLTGSGIQSGIYFSVPAILNSNYVTCWQPLPQPPKNIKWQKNL